MRNYTGYIIDYSDGNLSDQKRKWFEGELMHNVELKGSYLLFKQVNDYMRAKFDLDDAKNDPALKAINPQNQQIVNEFNENPNRYKDIRGFINQSLSEDNSDSELQKKILQSKREAEKFGINEVTGKWVNDWNTKNQFDNSQTESRRNFITESLNSDERIEIPRKSSWKKSYAIGITGLAAAAMITAVIVIKSLYPTVNPENLYQEYYEPLNAYTSTTRDASTVADKFTNAVELYKNGEYKSASSIFSDLLIKDSNNISVHFFAGLTQLQLGNTTGAITLLSEVESKNGDYKKEAQWYLGLAYLKSGDTKNAVNYLQKLAESKGYYQAKAQDLLNRLK